MKKKIGELYGKPIVTGTFNELKEYEILKESNSLVSREGAEKKIILGNKPSKSKRKNRLYNFPSTKYLRIRKKHYISSRSGRISEDLLEKVESLGLMRDRTYFVFQSKHRSLGLPSLLCILGRLPAGALSLIVIDQDLFQNDPFNYPVSLLELGIISKLELDKYRDKDALIFEGTTIIVPDGEYLITNCRNAVCVFSDGMLVDLREKGIPKLETRYYTFTNEEDCIARDDNSYVIAKVEALNTKSGPQRLNIVLRPESIPTTEWNNDGYAYILAKLKLYFRRYIFNPKLHILYIPYLSIIRTLGKENGNDEDIYNEYIQQPWYLQFLLILK